MDHRRHADLCGGVPCCVRLVVACGGTWTMAHRHLTQVAGIVTRSASRKPREQRSGECRRGVGTGLPLFGRGTHIVFAAGQGERRTPPCGLASLWRRTQTRQPEHLTRTHHDPVLHWCVGVGASARGTVARPALAVTWSHGSLAALTAGTPGGDPFWPQQGDVTTTSDDPAAQNGAPGGRTAVSPSRARSGLRGQTRPDRIEQTHRGQQLPCS